MKKSLKIALLVLLTLACLILPGLDTRLRTVSYEVETGVLPAPVRLALVTDLHSCAYGDGESTLVHAIDVQEPDLILLGGDIFDDVLSDDNAEMFLRAIGGRYPCYYVTGNHEYWAGTDAFSRKMAILEDCGIQRLSGDVVSIERSGARLDLCGVDDPRAWLNEAGSYDEADRRYEAQVAQAAEQTEAEGLAVLLAHRPEYAEMYAGYGFDLVLAGHAHGGQWRIPGILNGLFAPNQGLFPKYAGGSYEIGSTRMIVSRGLGRESTPLPRLYNRPELVIVTLR